MTIRLFLRNLQGLTQITSNLHMNPDRFAAGYPKR